MWLKSAPVTGTHNSKLREDNVHMLEPASPGKSLCPLSQRGKEGGRGGRGLAGSPSPSGAVQNKARLRRGRGSTEPWLHGRELKSHFLSLLPRFSVGFVLQQQPRSMLEKARVTTSSKGLGFEACLEGVYQLSPSRTRGHLAGVSIPNLVRHNHLW